MEAPEEHEDDLGYMSGAKPYAQILEQDPEP